MIWAVEHRNAITGDAVARMVEHRDERDLVPNSMYGQHPHWHQRGVFYRPALSVAGMGLGAEWTVPHH